MTPQIVLSAASFALLVGAALGVWGGGGATLLLPAFVYVLGLPPHEAIPLSLLVVGATSASALVTHARAGQVSWRDGIPFGLSGMAGAYMGGRLSVFVPPWALLSGFALLMLGTAASMLRPARYERPRASHPGLALPLGAVVGAVSGLVGAGGGFLIVPTLVLMGGIPMRRAVGTSLLVIAMQALAGFLARSPQSVLATPLPLLLVVAGIVGSSLGARLSSRITPVKLRRGFGWFVLALGTTMLVQQTASVERLRLPPLAPLLGGGLIGLGAALLWVAQGRVAGISGITRGLLSPVRGDRHWRAAFVLGLFTTGAVWARLKPDSFGASPAPIALLVASGLLVGVGTSLANGCTSGHGVCGVSRLSRRSLWATPSFMAAGFLVVFVLRHIVGGPS